MFIFYFSHLEASITATFSKTENLMYRWRRKSLPEGLPIVPTLASYCNIINLEEWQYLKTYSGGSLNICSVYGPDFDTSVVFMDIQFAKQICTEGKIYVDATFKLVPNIQNGY